jgi:hypothetical protein
MLSKIELCTAVMLPPGEAMESSIHTPLTFGKRAPELAAGLGDAPL